MKQILLLALTFLSFNILNAQTFEFEGINYTITDTENRTIEITNSPSASGDIVITSTVGYMGNTYTITSIGNQAFNNNTQITSVVIEENVTSIGIQAFSGCNGLTAITLPNGLTSIGNYAFQYSSGFSSITLPVGLETIRSNFLEYT